MENHIRAAMRAHQLRILHSPTRKARSIRRSYRSGTRRFLSPRLHTGMGEETRVYSASLTRNVRKCFGTYAIEAQLHRPRNHKYEPHLVRMFSQAFGEQSVLSMARDFAFRICCKRRYPPIRRTRERNTESKNNCARDVIVLGNAQK